MFEKIQQDAKKRYEKSTSVIMNRTIQTGVDKIYKAAYPTVESRVQRQLSELSGRLEKTFGNGNLSYKSVKDPKDTKHTWEAIIVETITIGAFIATLVFLGNPIAMAVFLGALVGQFSGGLSSVSTGGEWWPGGKYDSSDIER